MSDVFDALEIIGARLLDIETYSFWPARLAMNLAYGAALCRAHAVGYGAAISDQHDHTETRWWPGCGWEPCDR